MSVSIIWSAVPLWLKVGIGALAVLLLLLSWLRILVVSVHINFLSIAVDYHFSQWMRCGHWNNATFNGVNN